MFVRISRTAIIPVWLGAFGLAALFWSPLSVGVGVLLLLVAIAVPVAMLMWRGR
jgi:hypothetical protein